MRSARHGRGAPEQVGRGSTPEPVALMGALLVVELHERLERPLHRRRRGEVLPAKLNAPVFVQDRALQALHEAVGPRMARLRARVPNAQGYAGIVEGRLELRAAIGKYPLQGPARPPIDRPQYVAQEGRGGLGRERRQQPGPPVRAGDVAGGDLPDFADPLQLADVERVDRHQLAGLLGLDVTPPTPGAGKLRAGPLGQQPAGARAVLLQQPEAVAAPAQLRAPENALHRTRRQRHAHLPAQVTAQPATPPGRPGQGQPEHQPCDVGGDQRRAAGPRLPAAGMQPVGAVALETRSPAVEQRPRDPGLLADGPNVAQFVRAPHDAQAHPEYALVEGPPFLLPPWVPWPGSHSGKNRTDGPLLVPSSVSTLLRVGTA